MAYNRGNYIEQQRAIQEHKDRERDLKLQEIQIQMERRLLDQDQKIVAYRMELKDDIQQVKEQFSSLREYVVETFVRVNEKFDKEILHINKNIMDMKQQFGGEILRLDANQNRAMNALEKYANQVQQYKKDSEQIVREAKHMRKESEFILKRADHHFKKVALREQKVEQSLERFQGKMQTDFLKQKLMLDAITQQQHNALKDMAYEKMGGEIMKTEMSSRMESERKEMQLKLRDVQRLEEKVTTARSLMRYDLATSEKVQNLNNQLHLARERSMHQGNKMELMQRQHEITKSLWGK